MQIVFLILSIELWLQTFSFYDIKELPDIIQERSEKNVFLS